MKADVQSLRAKEAAAEPIAVVGIACRFPGGANSPELFWKRLCEGMDAVREVPESRWDLWRCFDGDRTAREKMDIRWGGFLDHIERFDPLFFGISPREARQIDPQQRLMLELAWEALEDAGIVPGTLTGSATGVFVGAMWSDYAHIPSAAPEVMDQYSAAGQDTGIIAGRVSYSLGLQGPSFVVNTASSSSLVAVHLARQSLLRGESTLAIAGGVHVIASPLSTVSMTKFGAASARGRCRAFDADADGYVRGEGGGAVILKRLSQALLDGDRIYCTVIGSAVNNDGFSNGLTAPNPKAQGEVLRLAYQSAGVPPERVHYVEAHGTGTTLGDPLEAGALGAVLGAGRQANAPLRIGSVKSNLGHLEAAGGIAGLVKVALSLTHRAIPKSLHFERPNPHIPFDALKLDVQKELTPWPRSNEEPLAGVSSFGFGGTNCHVVLRGMPNDGAQEGTEDRGRVAVLVPLSAKSAEALEQQLRVWAEWLGEGARHLPLPDIAYTASVRRTHHEYRAVAVGHHHAEIAQELLRLAKTPRAALRATGAPPQVAFLFPETNDVEVDTVRQLLEEDAFREAFMACDAALQEHTQRSVVAELHGRHVRHAVVPPDLDASFGFAVAVSLAALWASWGVQPSAILGRGLGEVAAAHVAGALRLSDAARVLAILARPHHPEERLDEARWAGIEPRACRVPLWSATRGLLSGERLDGAHWSVLLDASEALVRAQDIPCEVVLAVGRDPVPAVSVRTATRVDSLQSGKPAPTSLREAFGALHLAGVPLDWSRLFPGGGRVVSLPAYPWQRERCWVEGRSDAHARLLLAKNWTPAPYGQGQHRGRAAYLLVVNHDSTIDVLKDLRMDLGIDWIVIREAGLLPKLAPSEYELDFSNYRAGAELIERIGGEHPRIDGLVDLADLHALPRALPDRDEGRVALLQGLLRLRASAGLRIVHVTRGLVPFQSTWRTLAGAKMASLVRVVDAEHRAVRATTVDVDHGVERAEALLELVAREALVETPPAELCYRQGARYASRYTAIGAESSGPADALRMDPQKVYVVTGATGHLGAEVARWLVQRGARKLALLSQRPLPGRPAWPGGPPERATDADAEARLARVAALESLGVETVLFAGSLADAARLQGFFEHVETSLGAIGGVIHCAGSLGPKPSSFAQRELAALRATWEPKIDGLVALHGALGEARPDFFVLYSSVSAAVPQLAVGMADYASGNAFLDAFAAYHDARPAGTRYMAIDWPSWRDSGMGERAGARYFALGFTAHGRADGLALLERALGVSDCTSILPCVVDPASFDAAALLEPKKASPPPPEPDAVVERRASAHPHAPQAPRDLFEVTKGLVLDLLATELMLPRNRIEGSMTFDAYGVDSVMIADLVPKLERFTREPVEPGAILEHPTLDELSRFLSDSYGNGIQSYLAQTSGVPSPSATALPAPPLPARARTAAVRERPATGVGQDRRIAVIGMACRFPGAPDVATFLDNLRHGRSSITEVPSSRWDVRRLYGASHEDGKIVSKWGGFLEGIEEFDPTHYGIAEEDAAHVDPLVRIFLECTEQAMRDGGYDKSDVWGKSIGVFAGSGTTNYGYRVQRPTRSTVTGLNQNFIAAYAAHIFNLRGPNLVVDTACSSSLVSLHLACQSLIAGDCEMAIAGGADLLLDEVLYRRLSVAKALSPDGRCHTFDAKANGFVPGEGCGAVLLKPLVRAMADGDVIHAVIEGVAVNNDGHTMGLTTPNMKAQEELILAAHERAGTDPATVSYVEAHGTGTMIGDPIELKALTHVFRRFTDENQFCAIGSVKTNVGHLLLAAGMASLIKVVLSLKHQSIFPTLNCEEPNPRFSFSTSPFHPAQQLRAWLERAGVRRAGISSFGFGGTNAHAIVRGFDHSIDGECTVRRSPLPPISFAKKRYWIDPPAYRNTVAPMASGPLAHVPKRRSLLALEEGL